MELTGLNNNNNTNATTNLISEQLKEKNLAGMFGGYSGPMSNVTLVKFKVIEMGPRHNEAVRDRDMIINDTGLSFISQNIVENPTNVLNTMASAMTLSDSRDEIAIPNGWGAKRWHCELTLKEEKSNGTGIIYFIQGYTPEPDSINLINFGQAIEFKPNGYFIINKISTYHLVNGELIPEASDFVVPSSLTIGNSPLNGIRPKDIMLNIFEKPRLGAVLNINGIEDLRSSATHQTIRSNSDNSLVTGFMSKIVDGLSTGMVNPNAVMANPNIMDREMSCIGNAPIQEIKALFPELSGRNLNGNPHSTGSAAEIIPLKYIEIKDKDYGYNSEVILIPDGVDYSIVHNVAGVTQEATSSNSLESKYNAQIIEMVGAVIFKAGLSSFNGVFSNRIIATAQNGYKTSDWSTDGLTQHAVANLNPTSLRNIINGVGVTILSELNALFGHTEFTVNITAVEALMVVKLSIGNNHAVATTGSIYALSILSRNVGDAVSFGKSDTMTRKILKGIRDGFGATVLDAGDSMNLTTMARPEETLAMGGLMGTNSDIGLNQGGMGIEQFNNGMNEMGLNDLGVGGNLPAGTFSL